MKVWDGGGDFLALLKADTDVRKYLSDSELAANFDLDFHLPMSIRSSAASSAGRDGRLT